jgi:hypothetical protein
VRGVRVDDDSARDPAHDAARDAARDGPPPPRGTIRAERVIVTAPPREIFRVLDPGLFPARWVDEIRGRYWGAGLLTGWCGMRRSLLPEIGLDASSFVYMPAVIRDEGFIGAVDMVMCEFTAWGDGAARRAPPGRHDYYFSTALTEREMRDPARVGRVVELCEAWARRTFRDFDADCEFIVWTPGPDAYGHWRPVGSRRPDVRSPWVEGLHFAGDQYGERLWGGGVDAAALSAVLCVDAITGGELESQILPEHHRGLPRAVA